MTTLDDVLAEGAATQGPTATEAAGARRRLLDAIERRGRRRRLWRRGVVVPIALTFLAGGLAAGAAASGLFRLPSHGDFQGGERKAAVALSSGGLVELWAAQHPNPADCPMLRLRTRFTPPTEQVLCTLFVPERTSRGLSVHATSLPPARTILYGRTPADAANVVVHLADGTTDDATIGKGWYLAVTAATDQPVRVEATSADGTVLVTADSPAPAAAPAPADCATTAAQPAPTSPPASDRDDLRQHAQDPPGVVPLPGFPGGRWELFVYRSGHTLDIDYEATASDGSPGSGGGSGFDPKSKGLSLGWGTLTDRYDEASGAAPRSAACVVVTDTLGRRFATRALRVPAFEERTFWGVAFLHDAPLDHVTAVDASGHVVAFERPSL